MVKFIFKCKFDAANLKIFGSNILNNRRKQFGYITPFRYQLNNKYIIQSSIAFTTTKLHLLSFGLHIDKNCSFLKLPLLEEKIYYGLWLSQ